MTDAASHPQLVQRAPLVDAALRAPGAFYLIAVMSVFLTFWTPGFFTAANLTNVALQVTVLTIVALGMTLMILTEGLDLSLGPVLGLVRRGSEPGDRWWLSPPVAIGSAVMVGIVLRPFNGTLIAVAGMPPFIVTLGTFGIAQSIAMVLTQGNSVVNLPAYFRWFNDGVFLGIPVPIWATIRRS